MKFSKGAAIVAMMAVMPARRAGLLQPTEALRLD
jgi:ABC-type lipoprotein release transport system permease subunit